MCSASKHYDCTCIERLFPIWMCFTICVKDLFLYAQRKIAIQNGAATPILHPAKLFWHCYCCYINCSTFMKCMYVHVLSSGFYLFSTAALSNIDIMISAPHIQPLVVNVVRWITTMRWFYWKCFYIIMRLRIVAVEMRPLVMLVATGGGDCAVSQLVSHTMKLY